MGIFDSIIQRNRRSSAANKALKTCRDLFNNEHILAADMDALIDTMLTLGDTGIETFQLVLTQDDQHHDMHRQQQIMEMLADTNSQPAEETIIALLACFLEPAKGMFAAETISYLARYGTAATDVLLTALQNNNCRIRSYAAKALGNYDDQRVVTCLISALQDDDARVRSDAAESLGKLADAQAIEALIHALSDCNWLVRESASAALADFSHEINQLGLLLQHEKHQIRLSAVHIIQRMKHKQTVALLLTALNDPHPEVQREAVHALSSQHKAIIPLLTHFHQSNMALQQHIAAACKNIGMNRVAAQLSNQQVNIRIAVIKILAQLDCTELLPLLADAWQHENEPEVRLQIIIAIAQLTASAGENSPDSAVTRLIQATKSPDQNIVYHAQKALQSLPHPLAKQFLQPPLQNTNIAINCPSCLQPLQLKTPLTEKKWPCPHCNLSFSIHNGADDVLILTPLTATLQARPLANRSMPWFDILQINADADVNAIKRSFRSLLKQYHPDKVASLGTEFKQLAEEKTHLLTWALRTGLKQRGK